MPISHAEPAPTLDEVWRLFKENALQMQETKLMLREQSQEADRRFQETELMLREQSQEADRRLKEQSQEADRRFKEQSQEADRRFQETELMLKEQSQEADRRFRETERIIKELSRETDKKIGALGNRLGDFVEGFVAPAAIRLFSEWGLDVCGLSRNIEQKNPKLELAIEIDLFVRNGDSCVLIEVKSHLSVDDVNEHLERMAKFKLLFPEYADKRAYGAVAAMVIPSEVGRYAYRKGLFVIGQTGEAMHILNNAQFKPAVW